MNILWLASTPYSKNKNAHPVPWVGTLANALKANNINLTILNYSHQCDHSVEKSDIDGIKYIFIKTPHPKFDLLTFFQVRIFRLRRYLRRNVRSFDLVHIHGNEHQYELAMEGIDIPSTLSTQGIISEILKKFEPSGFQRIHWTITSLLEKRGYKIINNYSCRTDWDTGIIRDHNPDAKIFHVWEMIRKPFFDYCHRSVGANIIFLGGSWGLKGIDFALRAFNEFKKKVKDSQFLIGGNVDIKKIKKIIEANKLEININDDIKLLGFMDAESIISSYKSCFCLLHTSLIDNSPNSICEAQVVGLPVIATSVGGVPSLIEHNITGVLVDFNPLNIASNLFRLFESEDFALKISSESRKVARRRHNADRIVQDTISMYQTIINHSKNDEF